MQMRTIAEAFNEIKAQDNKTGLTLYGLQTLVKSGHIPSVKIGKKRLVNMSVINDYLQGKLQLQAETVEYGAIRKVTN